MKNIGLMVVGTLIVAYIGTAQASTDEEKCLAGRAKAEGKYEQCAEKWLAKGFGGGGFDSATLSKCSEKYAAVWTKLQALGGSATCGGQPRYVDNANGTVTDNLTGLVWEKKSDNGDIHDKDPTRTWSTGAPYNGNGTAFTTFLTTDLNSAGFAGANDWRLPTFAEIQTIEPYPCVTSPCVDAAFNTTCTAGCNATALSCSCTQSSYYWSASTHASDSPSAWVVGFSDGLVDNILKVNSLYARAVRGGL